MMFNIDSSKRNKAFIFLKYDMSTILQYTEWKNTLCISDLRYPHGAKEEEVVIHVYHKMRLVTFLLKIDSEHETLR